jgi:acetyl esterase/lipase
MERRPLAWICALMCAQGTAQAQAGNDADKTAEPSSLRSDLFLGLETFRLWPGRAEGATGDSPAETPTITVFPPQPGYANGTAVLVAPGGGYIGLAANLEGRQVADWFASRGITAFVLQYRVGPSARLPLPLVDGRRAVQFVRAQSNRFGIDPKRIGMIGFSAGGHLSAMTAAQAVDGRADAADLVERESSRPDFLILGYPWLEGTALDSKGQSQYCVFAGTDCVPGDYERYMPVRFVTGRMPPTFIYHTTTDSLVPVEGILRFYQALRASRVAVELHIFGTGEHGTGLGGADPALARWPELLEHWLRGLKLLERPAM